VKTTRPATRSPRPARPVPPGNRMLPAQVTDVRDPDGQGRVKVRLPPGVAGAPREAWARLATLMAGPNSGSWFVPDVNDEVLVAFDSSDPRQPYVIGSLWNGKNAPPTAMDPAGANSVKLLRSRQGLTVTLDDRNGQETLTVETPGGQRITLADGPGSIQIADANGNSVSLAPAGITINAAAKVAINASEVTVSAGAVLVNAGTSRFSGVVQCDTLVANSVVSSSYTPGAGNVW